MTFPLFLAISVAGAYLGATPTFPPPGLNLEAPTPESIMPNTTRPAVTPPAPTLLRAEVSGRVVRLYWQADVIRDDVEVFTLERTVDGRIDHTFTVCACKVSRSQRAHQVGETFTWQDRHTAPCVTFSYRIRSQTQIFSSAWTEPVIVTVGS